MKKLTGIILSITLVISLLFPMRANAAPSNAYDYSLVFDWEYYYNTYSDLQQNIGKDEAALFYHFLTSGMKEGRNGCANFQLRAYMFNNLDLLGLYGIDDLSVYYYHYMKKGHKEGRVAIYPNGVGFPQDTLACFSTLYKTGENRGSNVELAASKLNGLVIQPGQAFSFSDSIQPRTLENGYLPAASYSGGQVISSVGGGICQVSSTLYVTMLLSGIPATEHHFHSMSVSYVPKGLDATISEGHKDLCFINPYACPITVVTNTQDGILTIAIKQVTP